ncbi:MAG TPA: methyl-accepting chemotaxis protein, partial [Nitrospirota bacterium]
AAEEMSSTAEELSSQSEQLQNSIAFFRVGDNGASRDRRVTQLMHAAHLAQKPRLGAPAAPIRRPGVALNLGHDALKGGDARDVEYEKF